MIFLVLTNVKCIWLDEQKNVSLYRFLVVTH